MTDRSLEGMPASSEAPKSSVAPAIKEQGNASKQPLALDRAKALDAYCFPNPPPHGGRFPPTTIANVAHVIDSHGIKVAYNVIGKRLRHEIPGLSIARDNADNVALTEILSLCVLNNLQSGLVPGFVDAIADRRRFNPVKDWIESKPWDGVDRLAAIQATLTVREDFPVSLRNLLIHKWLRSAAAAAVRESDFRCRGVLTLQGDQSIGKTSWVLALVPEQLRTEFLKIDHCLDPNSKDSVITAVSHWMVEIGELDSSLKKDVARLKGFLTSPTDKVRRPYARSDSEYPRRTVFCATVNSNDFLVDMTGNSRWWTLPVVAINFNHQIDTQQLFAQMAEEVNAGMEWWLTQEEERLLDKQNSAHLSSSVIRERMLSHLAPTKHPKARLEYRMMKSVEVLEDVLQISNPTNAQMKECASVLRELIGTHKRINGFNKWQIPFRVKPPKTEEAAVGRVTQLPDTPL